MAHLLKSLFILSALAFLPSCPLAKKAGEDGGPGRLVMFVGFDISGSFTSRWYYNDSIRFMAHYIYSHLRGLGGLEKPSSLFVGSIGGARPDEPKTFYPIQTFEHRSIEEIRRKLIEIFPANVRNPFTDYNAFFEQISVFVKNKKLMLKPIDIVMLTDGIPDAPTKDGKADYRTIKLDALELLSRNITVRVLYTSASTGINWQTKVPRERVKVWTQDANVMKEWKSPTIIQPRLPFPQQKRFFEWIGDNVNFKVPRKRVE
jgi:hypothetical protein